jgi:6-phosphofructokinase
MLTSTDSFFIVELMGRKAGWITYAAGIAAEAIMILLLKIMKRYA